MVDIASAVTPWNRACAGQRWLKMCESFQSAASGAAAVIRFSGGEQAPAQQAATPSHIYLGHLRASDRPRPLTVTLRPPPGTAHHVLHADAGRADTRSRASTDR